MSKFGERLKGAMLAAGLTDTAVLAEKINVSPQIIRKWLRSRTPNLSAGNIVSLSEALNVRVLWLANARGPIHAFTAQGYSDAEMVNAFRTLTDVDKRLVRDFIGLLMRYQAQSAAESKM
jgi:transcriptional regulator with XRE-family HTH domain